MMNQHEADLWYRRLLYRRAKRLPAIRAKHAVAKAIKEKQLKREPCVKCGDTRNVDGHHEDYSKPLEVVWLCRSHHSERHIEMRAEKKRARRLKRKLVAFTGLRADHFYGLAS